MLLRLQNITHNYGTKCALNNITLTLDAPNLVAIIGPNGGGKSTLLKLIAGILQVQQGTFTSATPTHKIAYMPQQSTLDHNFPIRVQDVVAMGLYNKTGPFKKRTPADDARITDALTTVGLQDMEHRLINTLSGGQFQRMMFARTIVQDADLLLLDEPFAAIDSETKQKLMEIIQAWHVQGKTIIVVLHDIKLAADYFPHIIMLSHMILKAGTPQEVFGEDLLNSTLFTHTLRDITECL